MRFLKNKILKAEEAQRNKLKNFVKYEEPDYVKLSEIKVEEPSPATTQTCSPTHSSGSASPLFSQPKKRARKTAAEKLQAPKTRHSRPTKNITINYGKAIASFAVSALAIPYIQDYLAQEQVTHNEFVSFINRSKDTIGGIEGLKNLLQINDTDDYRVQICKRAFKIASEVFIKYFSVNWITHGKVTNKLVYLQFRGKMLRRVQNPESFTYIKKRTKKN